ncbi:MAG: F0F1 ATP synthase subunit delta [Deltaproteobacteria bacterium]|nr:F0F1 ATP synthase subunit delta [Deltaproteobacteria bacterium]
MIDLTVARRYAKALLTLGKEDGKYKEYGEGISGFAALMQREPELRDALLNPVHSQEDRHKLLLRMIELLQMSPMVANLLQLMFDKHRLDALDGVAQAYQQLVDEVENVSRAKVKTAIFLDDATQERLRQTMEKLTGSTVVMEVEEDPSIIGGIVARVGDLVLDGSVRTQINSLRESLIKGEVL